jgi:phosphoglycolate phosphatase
VHQHRYRAVIFDKDGTLLDVEQTWSPAIATALTQASNDGDTRRRLAEVMGFDVSNQTVLPNAPIMTLSNAQIAELAQPFVDGWVFINSVADRVVDTVTPTHDAETTLAALNELGIPLAIVTNDEERSTKEQLTTLEWDAHFDPVYGYDSGYGCKPDPEVVTAAARALGATLSTTMMVGDSATDLIAARAAGVTAVLVGDHPHNAHLADVCIDNLSDVLTLL